MYKGPTIDDFSILAMLPGELTGLLSRCNGYVAYHGGFHVRGACLTPAWHSLRYWWFGDTALHRLFAAVDPDDIPFAEDALGDQYLLRAGSVHRLSGETGEIRSLEVNLTEFDKEVRKDPIGYLSLAPLVRFRKDGGSLQPGQLLSVYPPFVFKESASGVCYQAVSAEERIPALADLARQLRDVPDGTEVTIRVEKPKT